MRNPYYPLPIKNTRRPRTEWISGPDPLIRDKYYAFLKHRSQAHYRRESYELDFEDWLEFWTDSNWQRRGRKGDSLCLIMRDPDFGWCRENCVVTTRRECARRIGQRRRSQTHDE